jgi:hypothetical protein
MSAIKAGTDYDLSAIDARPDVRLLEVTAPAVALPVQVRHRVQPSPALSLLPYWRGERHLAAQILAEIMATAERHSPHAPERLRRWLP